MARKIVVNRRSYSVVKLDAGIWHEMARFLENKYEEISITIDREEGTDIADSVGFAYQIVCEHTEKIKYINIKASGDSGEIRMEFKVKRSGSGCSLCFYSESKDKETAREARIFADRLLSVAQASTNMIHLSAVAGYYTFFYVCMVLQRNDLLAGWLIGVMLAAGAVTALFLDFFVCSPLVEKWIYSDERVQLWVDERDIAKYRQQNRKSRAVGWMIFSGVFVMMALVVLFLFRI